MYKIEVADDDGVWRDVRGSDGKILTFEKENEARAKLTELYPVLVQMEKFIAPKRTRVITIWDDEEEDEDAEGKTKK